MLTGLKADVDTKGSAKMALDVYATSSTKVGRELRAVYPKTQLDAILNNDKVKRYPKKFKADLKIDEEAVDATKKQPIGRADAKSSTGKSDKSVKKEGESKSAKENTSGQKSQSTQAADVKATASDASNSTGSPSTAPNSGDAKADAREPADSTPDSKTVPSAVPGTPAVLPEQKKEG